MSQSKKNSIIEVIINVGSGFFTGVLIQIIIFPWFGLSTNLLENMLITFIFTVVSILRGYTVRRIFNKYRNN